MPTASGLWRIVVSGLPLGGLLIAGCAAADQHVNGAPARPAIADGPLSDGKCDSRIGIGRATTADCEVPSPVAPQQSGTNETLTLDLGPQASEFPAVVPAAEVRTNDDDSSKWVPIRMTDVLDDGTVLPPSPTDADEPFADVLNEQPVHDLDLGTALSLVAGRSPRIEFADARVREAQAQWQQANVLWLPSLRVGASFNRHEGMLQNSGGQLQDVNRSSLEAGFGVQAVGAGTPVVPGLVAQFHLADAIFQPIIAERAVASRNRASTAVTNDQLLAAALAYLDLLAAEQFVAISQETVENAKGLVELTKRFAETGQGSQADADRAQADLSLRRNDLARAQESAAVASARLAETLSLDAGYRFRPMDRSLMPIELVAADFSVRDAVATGLATRPELQESRFLVSEAVQRLKRERYAPLVPSLLLGLSYGGFGGGEGSHIGDFQDRTDFDAVLFWEVRNLGLGERAARNEACARVEQAQAREIQTMDRVAREVVEAYVQVSSRRRQIEIAESGITAAEQSYRRNVSRIFEGQGLPIEVLQAIQALDQARRDYMRSLVDYNAAQFRLHRALGWPIQAGSPLSTR